MKAFTRRRGGIKSHLKATHAFLLPILSSGAGLVHHRSRVRTTPAHAKRNVCMTPYGTNDVTSPEGSETVSAYLPLYLSRKIAPPAPPPKNNPRNTLANGRKRTRQTDESFCRFYPASCTITYGPRGHARSQGSKQGNNVGIPICTSSGVVSLPETRASEKWLDSSLPPSPRPRPPKP